MADVRPQPRIPLGLTQFFSSQADVLFAQYMNIEHLIGETDDYTAPGTHCEVLLRDFLRAHLPSWICVDKGFIYGRTNRWTTGNAGGIEVPVEKESHCPEIDILLHDTHLHRPVFRLEDFVIVQPEAVLGIIQVKRTLSTDQFRSGVCNVVDAKRHLLEMYFQKAESRERLPEPHFFSAVVEFADANRHNSTFRDRLKEAYDSQAKYESSHKESAKIWVLPSFIGSITGKFSISTSSSIGFNKQDYAVYSAQHNGHNVGLQALLHLLTAILWQFSSRQLRPVAHEQPPFAFPDGMLALDQFSIPFL